MEKLVSTTFKILAMSMLFMLLLDTSLLLVEVISIHSKVSNLTGIMQMEIAKNNYMPDAMGYQFEEFLYDIARSSTIMNNANPRADVQTNFEDLEADDAGEYGDIKELKIEMTIHPSFAYYNPQRNDSDSAWLKKDTPLDYTLIYEYQVPCLRYLK